MQWSQGHNKIIDIHWSPPRVQQWNAEIIRAWQQNVAITRAWKWNLHQHSELSTLIQSSPPSFAHNSLQSKQMGNDLCHVFFFLFISKINFILCCKSATGVWSLIAFISAIQHSSFQVFSSLYSPFHPKKHFVTSIKLGLEQSQW